MKKVQCYWVETVFDIKKHWIEVRHNIEIEVPENATEEEILSIVKRKDLKLV